MLTEYESSIEKLQLIMSVKAYKWYQCFWRWKNSVCESKKYEVRTIFESSKSSINFIATEIKLDEKAIVNI